MKTEKFSGTMENAYGQPLPTPVKFSGDFQAYENVDEIRSANDWPNNDEIVTFVNNKRKANARQKAMNTALEAAGIAKPTLEDPNVALRETIKILKAQGRSEEQAEQIAKQMLGL